MGFRPGMRTQAVRATRSQRMPGIRFATHGALAGGSIDGNTRLVYLAVGRQPSHMHYSVTWPGRLTLTRELSVSLLGRILHTRAVSVLERLLTRFAQAMPLGQGLRTSWRPLTNAWRVKAHRLLAVTAHDVAVSHALLNAMHRDDTHTLGVARPPVGGQRLASTAWPLVRTGDTLRLMNVSIDARRTFFRTLLERRLLVKPSASGSQRSVVQRVICLASALNARHLSVVAASVTIAAALKEAARQGRAFAGSAKLTTAPTAGVKSSKVDERQRDAVSTGVPSRRPAPIAVGSRSQGMSPALLLAWRGAQPASVSPSTKVASMVAAVYPPRHASPTVITYRETQRVPELQTSKLVQRIEQQVTRKIVHDIKQATPARSDVEKAVLTPRVIRALAEQVGGMLSQQVSFERYRRGL